MTTLTAPVTTRTTCRVCPNDVTLTPVLDLGSIHISAFPRPGAPPSSTPVPLQLLRCPHCWGTFAKIFLVPGPTAEEFQLKCRACAGLTYASAQRHDARRDQAARDPRGFLEGRAHLKSLRSQLRTIWIAEDARRKFEERLLGKSTKRGRGWGRKSMTRHQRGLDQMAREYEARWRRPLPGRPPSLPHQASFF